jgi:hypothetical protein
MKILKIHIYNLFFRITHVPFKPDFLRQIKNNYVVTKHFGLCFNVYKLKNEILTIKFDKSMLHI